MFEIILSKTFHFIGNLSDRPKNSDMKGDMIRQYMILLYNMYKYDLIRDNYKIKNIKDMLLIMSYLHLY